MSFGYILGAQKMTRILSSEFVLSANSWSQLEDLTLPEVAFVGRSNVGKSTLLNALCGRKSLAVTSKTPGRTQMLNYFKVKIEPENVVHFVDLPGFGYAEVSKQKKKEWAKFVTEYLLEREPLKLILLLVDCRREMKEEEEWVLSLSENIPVVVVFTKSDKLGRNELAKKMASLDNESVCTSAAPKNKSGMDKLIEMIARELDD